MMFKSIFKKGLLVGVTLTGLIALPAISQSQVFYTVRGLLSEQFSSSERVGFVQVAPSGDALARVERRLGSKLPGDSYTFYVARTGDHVDGYALFDEERGQHELISFATFFDARGSITRVEIVAYREAYGDGIRASRFRSQFVGRNADSSFRPNDDIDAVSGATISSRSLSRGVERASVLLDEVVLHADKSVVASR